jgi:hypothetical protein
VKGLVVAVEAIILFVLGAAYIVSGRLLGAAILVGLAALAAGCAWALRSTSRELLRTRAGGSPRKAGSNPPRRR